MGETTRSADGVIRRQRDWATCVSGCPEFMNNNEAEPYTLEDWAFEEHPATAGNAYLAPEQRVMCLTGRVFGNYRFIDGEPIITSRLICAVTDDVVQTMNSFYKLGKPAEEYERQYPNAKQRLIDQLRKQCS